MDDLNQPYFEISETISDGNGSHFVGRFSAVSAIHNGFAYLLILPDKMVEGKISNLSEQNSEAVFIPTDPQLSILFRPNERYRYFDGYWGERAAIVLDGSRVWQKVRFKPSNAVKFKTAGGTAIVQSVDSQRTDGPSSEIVPGGWDHEHCAIDWTRIDQDENPYGYQDQHEIWVCVSCYEKYIVPKSLKFIVDA